MSSKSFKNNNHIKIIVAVNSSSYPYIEEYSNNIVKFFNAHLDIYLANSPYSLKNNFKYIFIADLPFNLIEDCDDLQKNNIYILNVDQFPVKIRAQRYDHFKLLISKNFNILTKDYFMSIDRDFSTFTVENNIHNMLAKMIPYKATINIKKMLDNFPHIDPTLKANYLKKLEHGFMKYIHSESTIKKFVVSVRAALYPYIDSYCDAIAKMYRTNVSFHSTNGKYMIDDKSYYIFIADMPNDLININKQQKNKIRVINIDQFPLEIRTRDYDHMKLLIANNFKVFTFARDASFKETVPMEQFPLIIDKDDINKLKSLTNEYKYDVAFCGYLTPRRIHIINEIRKNGINIVVMDKEFGQSRDKIIAQSKILLNIHAYPGSRAYENIRCDRWFAAGKIVLTEDCFKESYHDSDNFLYISEYDKIVSKIKEIILNFDKFQQELQKKLPSLEAVITERNKLCQTLIPIR